MVFDQVRQKSVYNGEIFFFGTLIHSELHHVRGDATRPKVQLPWVILHCVDASGRYLYFALEYKKKSVAL